MAFVKVELVELLKDLTVIFVAVGAFLTIGYSVYVCVTKADGAVFMMWVAGISALATLAAKQKYDQRYYIKYRKKQKV